MDENLLIENLKIIDHQKDTFLIPENIKKDVTILGVTGNLTSLDTSDATAIAYDIIMPKTAYVNGVKITGSMMEADSSSMAANSVTYENNYLKLKKSKIPTRTVVKASGYIQISAKASEVAPVIGVTAEKLKQGETILNVTGTYEGLTEKDVNFYDYDGTLIDSYTKTDFLALSAMPDNPTHAGLTAQGWNWTLADAKTHVTTYGKLTIGQNYTTTSGECEFDIELTPATGLTATMNMVGTKDWGDGSTDSATSHTYADYGTYTITCNGSTLPSYTFSSADYTLKHARLTNVLIDSNALRQCYSLEDISLPTGISFNGTNQFYNCYALKAVIIPSGITSIPRFYALCKYGFKSCLFT